MLHVIRPLVNSLKEDDDEERWKRKRMQMIMMRERERDVNTMVRILIKDTNALIPLV